MADLPPLLNRLKNFLRKEVFLAIYFVVVIALKKEQLNINMHLPKTKTIYN